MTHKDLADLLDQARHHVEEGQDALHDRLLSAAFMLRRLKNEVLYYDAPKPSLWGEENERLFRQHRAKLQRVADRLANLEGWQEVIRRSQIPTPDEVKLDYLDECVQTLQSDLKALEHRMEGLTQ